MDPLSIEEINKKVQAELAGGYKRPQQIMEQAKFDAWFLGTLNRLALQASKGERAFQIIDENKDLLRAVFAYLNRSSDENLLTYTRRIRVKRKTPSGDEEMQFSEDKVTLSLEKGLAIIGNFGIGKTLLLKAIHTNMRELQLTGRFFTARQVFEAHKITSKEAYETNQKDLAQIVGSDKYGAFMDDLGAEPRKAVKFGEEDTPVGNFLLHRINEWDRLRLSSPEQMTHDARLFVTSNVPIEGLKEIYGGRAVSRIYGACNVIISNQKTDFRKV